jgi:ABC-type phosphate transport system substrate-binding protein
VSIDDGNGAVEPSLETVAEYPMARPLHIYSDANAGNSDIVNGYLSFALSDEGQDVCDEVGYVKVELVDPGLLQLQRAALD